MTTELAPNTLVSGIFHAQADDGTSLPVIDLTHPAFAPPTDAELVPLVASFEREQAFQDRLPRWVRWILLRIVLRRSVLGKALRGAKTHLSGLGTYLFKLGPAHIGAVSPHAIDRRLAGSLAGASMRLRLSDMATLLAEHLAPLLDARPRAPLHLVGLAGGPCADLLNALLLLHKEDRKRLQDRAIHVHALDVDAAGPAFGRRSLEALAQAGGPLGGLDVSLLHVPYDWNDPAPLAARVSLLGLGGGLVAVSSEGGLFEYGDDALVRANLNALSAGPAETFLVGSFTSDGDVAMKLNRSTAVRLHPRSVAALEALAGEAGWRVDRLLDRALSRDVRLVQR